MKAIPKCTKPLNGTLFLSGTAGADSSVVVHFNLDQASPKAQTTDEETGEVRDYFSEKTVSLARDETVAFQVVAETQKRYCEFTLTMEVLSNSGTSTQVINNNGKPFMVTADLQNPRKYRSLYISGLANQNNWDVWTRANPKTYQFE